MKWVGGAVAIVLAGLVAFQNCQPAPHPDDLLNSGQKSTESESKIELQGQKISGVNFLFTESEKVSRNSGTYDVLVNKSMKVSLPSGEIILGTDLDSKTSRFCLTETLTTELINILKMAQICKKPAPPAGTLCTMAIQLPYAEIVTEKETFALGGASDGCGSNSSDLCDEQSTILQGFIASVKANYKSFECAQ